jgi:ribosome-binding factor A
MRYIDVGLCKHERKYKMPQKNRSGSAFKKARINEEIAKELGAILRTVKDPRISGGFLSIVGVDTTPDLKFCKVRFSLFGGDAKEAAKGLKSASGYIRHELASRLNLRLTPELTFIPDTSIEHGAHISALIDSLHKDEK